MANSTVGTLRTRVLDQLARAGVATTRSGVELQTQAITWINDAMQRMARTHDFREMHRRYTATTAAQQKTYTFPSNYKDCLSLMLRDGTNSRKLQHLSARLFDKRIPYPEVETTGTPVWYIPSGDEFDLFPIPEKVYTMYIRTVQWPTVVTDPSEYIDYEKDKDDIVTAAATAQGFYHLQMYEDGAYWDQIFLQRLREGEILDDMRPDYDPVALGYPGIEGTLPGEYWNNISIERNP